MSFVHGLPEVGDEMPDLDIPYSEIWEDFPGGVCPLREFMNLGEGDFGNEAAETGILSREEEMERRIKWAENPILKEMLPSSIASWERFNAQRERAESRPPPAPPTKPKPRLYPTIFLVGNEHSGKTSMLNLFLGREHAEVQRTIYVDYEFARRPRPDGERDVCRFWELGGDPREYKVLIDYPFQSHEYVHHGFTNLAIFIVLDLSRPISIWPAFETIMTQLKSGFQKALKQIDTATSVEIAEELEEKLSLRLEGVVEGDREFVDPFHIPLVIFGAKYDLFQNLEPETVKTVCRVLRLCAHITGATLCFYSKEDPVLKRRFRELVSHYGFHTKFPTGREDSGPLFIPAGTDSFEKIWPSRNPAQCTLDFCKDHCESRLGVDVERPDPNFVHPANDPRYADPVFDRLLAEAKAKAKAYFEGKKAQR